jgi:esterase
MSEIRVNGASIYYEQHGSGDPIVGIHGSLSSAAFWGDAARALARRGRVIVYDRRGCARSERPEPYATDLHEQADDAAALISALDAAPAIVIGRSYGADAAIDLALRHPHVVRALVLLEGGESISEAGRRWLAEVTAQVLAVAEVDLDTVAETVVRAVLGEGAWEELPEPVREVFTANGPSLLAELRGGLLDVTADELGGITQPALLVTGEDSPSIYAEVTDLLAAAMPAARVERVEGGHMIDPAHAAVLSFVDEVLSQRVPSRQ